MHLYFPMYLSVEQAAEMSGIGERTIRDWLNSSDPMPYIKLGNKRLIQRDALPEYLEQRQEVKR